MSRWHIAALLVALAQRPAPGDPGAFVKRVISQIVRDDYARAWRWILTPERYEYYLAGGCAPGLP